MALPSRLLVVTDRHQAMAPLDALMARLFEQGVRWAWLRDRDLPPEERRALAFGLAASAREAGATLSIGEDVDLAVAVGAGGVHLRGAADVGAARQRLGAGVVIGVSAHSSADVMAARDAGADYATLSPVFASASKPGYGPALGLSALGEAARLGLPVLALGGIDASNAGACLAAGAGGVALMGGPMRFGVTALPALTRRS